ncbi:MAG: L,D-transpeptidase family protein [Rhodospirillaceae bacterium]|nr:L,D-transpeptidase family protein [Rhodospirillaceae bacterium]
MTILVISDKTNPTRGTLRCEGREFTCALGRAGVSVHKHEGDGATPLGTFPIRRVFYRADRVPKLDTKLPTQIIAPRDGWCDAPTDARYNQFVTLPYPAGAEALWREDEAYDVIVVLGHNDAPVVPFAGSAIFLHVAAADFSPTAGCVALRKDDLLWVLSRLNPASTITIQSA